MKALFGSSSQASTNTSGYSALSPTLRAAFDPLGSAIAKYTNPNNAGVTESFTPVPLSETENAAIGKINAGFAPTSSSINSDMAMQMNPFNDSVIGEINRQGQGEYSVLKQAMDAAGQTGSNRGILGANDVDLSRMGVIGQFLQSQFNTSMNNTLTTLPNARAADATSQLGVGDLLRQLDLQTKQAPVNALLAGTGMIAPFTAGGSGSSNGSSSGGIIPAITNLINANTAAEQARNRS